MNIDPEQLKSPENIPSVILAAVKEARLQAWNTLKEERLSSVSPDDLTIMEALWNHGFTQGADAVVSVVATISTARHNN